MWENRADINLKFFYENHFLFYTRLTINFKKQYNQTFEHKSFTLYYKYTCNFEYKKKKEKKNGK